LDGLDEVRQESRAKCVEAINEFRKQNGLTSLTVCSRSQDYANLNAKLSFEGAIEVQPLTQEQIAEFLNRFGDEVAGINRALEKDNALREMSEMPLFLSIMLMAYRNKRDVDIWVSQDEKAQRKHLIDTYIERMFERPRSKGIFFKKQEVLCWLSWLASKMKEHNQIQYVFENMQPNWLDIKKQVLQYNLIYRFLFGLIIGTTFGFVLWFFAGIMFGVNQGFEYGLDAAAVPGIFVGVLIGLVAGLSNNQSSIILFDFVSWNWNRAKVSLVAGLATGLFCGLVYGVTINPYDWKIVALVIGLFLGLIGMAGDGLQSKRFDREKYPGQKVIYTLKSFFSSFLVVCFTGSLISALVGILIGNLLTGLVLGLMGGAASGLIFGTLLGLKKFGGLALIQHYALRYILARNNLLPWRLVPFLDHCVDLIFLRRVGGGYIFVHRLLMEHFADMYVETPISKGNQK
jgi:MFS family permease